MRTVRNRGFTLIEILVVVAIIALLISILLPSLARSRAVARMLLCQTNLKQLSTAFATYTVENKGRLPGVDAHCDWLGGLNRPKNPQPGQTRGRQPEDGTIFKHMGRNRMAYVCPDDNAPRNYQAHPYDTLYSYTSNVLIDGAKVEQLVDAHYRKSADPADANNFSTTNHAQNMRSLGGAPILMEEDPTNYLTDVDDSAWGNDDCIANRHLPASGISGYGNLAFQDTHVGRVLLTSKVMSKGRPYFSANSMCTRTKGGKWVSGRVWSSVSYGFMDRAPAAGQSGISGHK